ncbi:MAG TPA: M14 family metallopeptidase [Thermoleophilaceae bacterium]|nr:M14 family metallopeptidase [Thermoleophilaceae bacterium]
MIGHSVRGRPLAAVELGDPAGARRVLVVGCIHGNECAGEAVTRRLRTLSPPAGVDLWVVDDLNPDGHAAGTRQNAHGVDLNRNFGFRWRPLGGIFNSGPHPFSEPESRAARRLILRLHPAITIWFHQHLRLVDAPGGDTRIERRYARLVGLPLRRLPPYHGTATRWENHNMPGTTAFVVELPAGPMPAAAVRRHARAVLTVAAG